MSSTNEGASAVGARLKHLRELKRLTQPEIAEALGISLRGYQNYERGERSPSEDLIRAAWSTFGVDPIWLLTGEGEMVRGGAGALGESSAAPYRPDLPPGLAGMEPRIAALLALLDQLAPEAREAIVSDALSRAATAQQIADLRCAVIALTDAKRTGS